MLRRDINLMNAQFRTPANKEDNSLGSAAANRGRVGTDDIGVKNSASNNTSPRGTLGQQWRMFPPKETSSSGLTNAPASGNSSELLESQPPEARSGADGRRHRIQNASVLSKPSPPTTIGLHKGGNTLPEASADKTATNLRKRSSSVDISEVAPPRREVPRASHGSRGGERKNEAQLSGLAGESGDLLVDATAHRSCAGSTKSQPFEGARWKHAPTSSLGSRACKPRVYGGNSPGGMQAASRIGRLLRGTAVMGSLVAWATFFGARTLRRCEDWNSERALFESALRVCPHGIKTLNNLASGMLNVDEAPRAEGLLQRAIEVRSEGVRDRRRS